MSGHRRRAIVAAATASSVITLAAGAHASIKVFAVPVSIPTAARTGSGSQLFDYDCVDLKVSVSPGDYWAGAELHVQLPPVRRFFAADNSGGDYTPTFRTGGTGNYYAFDTAVMAPGFNGDRATILGSSSRKNPPDGNATFPSNGSNWGTGQDDSFTWTSWVPANDMSLLDVSWGDPAANTNTATGVQTIARMTWQKGSFPFPLMIGRVTSTGDPTHPVLFTLFVDPEPSAVAMTAAGIGVLSLRRRK